MVTVSDEPLNASPRQMVTYYDEMPMEFDRGSKPMVTHVVVMVTADRPTTIGKGKGEGENPQDEEKEEEKRTEKTRFWGFLRVIFSNTWWTDLREAVGQRINVEGIVFSVLVFFNDRHLSLPHVAMRDIRYIDWSELHRRGFKGVVFDKDNTITFPYSLTLWPPLRPSIDKCEDAFGTDIAVFSNSAEVKKPAGTAEEIEKHFGYKSSQLIMAGDRPFTDDVYGNRNGFFTILTEPFSVVEEPFIVRQCFVDHLDLDFPFLLWNYLIAANFHQLA
ncbi:putative Brassinosteroid-regulated protein BRU1 precursor [Hibiscus syriacus]|uniref:Brassinosteroid-regulated protein BRU1 n=1 Tax=Hibiscus syriacus TaxID=106335 RepID=A0A6A2Y2C3_HIBSY|nr:putative Brassinosteroid-regulated protein BRU1 precursor [Hibiscus syriacus]